MLVAAGARLFTWDGGSAGPAEEPGGVEQPVAALAAGPAAGQLAAALEDGVHLLELAGPAGAQRLAIRERVRAPGADLRGALALHGPSAGAPAELLVWCPSWFYSVLSARGFFRSLVPMAV